MNSDHMKFGNVKEKKYANLVHNALMVEIRKMTSEDEM